MVQESFVCAGWKTQNGMPQFAGVTISCAQGSPLGVTDVRVSCFCRVEDSEWRGPGRQGKRNRGSREPTQAWTASAALLHSASNVPQRLRTVPRSSSQASNAR